MKIKNEYKGCVIRQGRLTCDVDKMIEDDHQFYFDNGFDYIFIKDKTIKYKGIDEPRG